MRKIISILILVEMVLFCSIFILLPIIRGNDSTPINVIGGIFLFWGMVAFIGNNLPKRVGLIGTLNFQYITFIISFSALTVNSIFTLLLILYYLMAIGAIISLIIINRKSYMDYFNFRNSKIITILINLGIAIFALLVSTLTIFFLTSPVH